MAENIVASCLTGAVSQAGADLTNYATTKISLSQSMEKNYETLGSEVTKLQALRDDYEREVKKHKMKTTTSTYDVWLRSVNRALDKAKELEDRFKEDRKLSSRYIHVKRRSNYSGKLEKMIEEIVKLVEDGKFLGGFLVDKPLEPVLKVNAPDIKGFPSLQRPLEQVLDLLRNDKLKGIGICGTLGVGKTTIMQNLNNHDEVAKMFDIVIWANVSSERGEEKLQEDIARRLKLKMEGIHPEDVARTIAEELNCKKYLLLLDEVLDSIDLEDIGIPPNKNGSKVVLTTEFRHVCSSMADRLIEVHPLSTNEAWKMFQQMVTDVVDLPDIEPVAQLVAKECARLPLLIKTVAGAFKLKDSVSEWRKGLKDLRKWPEIEIPGLTELHSFLKFCYDQLKDDQKRKCFLYGALYPAESKIYTDYLLECWAAEGLLGNVSEKRRFQDARDEGYDTLKYLTNVSLLEKGERMIYVQMNNSIRQVALYISSQDPDCKFLTGMSDNSSDFLEENDWQEAKRISMIDKKLRELPESPNCSMLLSLLLQRNSNLTEIPQSFFESMRTLLVLDLYGTGIDSLPSSLVKLTGLKGLYLNNCIHLTELPPEVGELHCLEVLDIRGCRISFIPFHIKKLVNLKCLRVSYYKSSNPNDCLDMEIDCNVIQFLVKLEELMIDVVSYDHWCNEVVDVLRQVATLEKLTTLRICFPRSEVLKTFMQHSPSWKDRQQLTSFRFFVGCQNRKRPQILECFKYKINRYLRYCLGKLSDDSTICDLLAETDALELIEHKDITSLTDFEYAASLKRIRGFLIERCSKMITIADGNNMTERVILPNLEQLLLVNLQSLQTVFQGSLSTRSLSKLHTLVVTSCPMLRKIFSLGVIQQLSKLCKLVIQYCPQLEELIEKPNRAGQVSPAFPCLETLILIEMPKLRTICVDKSLAWSCLKELQVYGCPELKSLPFDKDGAANLKSIEVERIWWEALSWPPNAVKEQLQPICNLR
ncbi:Disease resistance protein [Corchorus olitorius]|uniref:Disease resistance protein n=1 Tax=Corchorus olitorius TaxID=93759 RepID=A0A1R3HI74_9ROSI|nr:Disease resistance protein [Corchorus olitorius]